MTANLRTVEPDADWQRQIVQCLKDALAKAEAGDFGSVHVIIFPKGERTLIRYSAGNYDLIDVIAALATAQHQIIASNTSAGEDL